MSLEYLLTTSDMTLADKIMFVGEVVIGTLMLAYAIKRAIDEEKRFFQGSKN